MVCLSQLDAQARDTRMERAEKKRPSVVGKCGNLRRLWRHLSSLRWP